MTDEQLAEIADFLARPDDMYVTVDLARELLAEAKRAREKPSADAVKLIEAYRHAHAVRCVTLQSLALDLRDQAPALANVLLETVRDHSDLSDAWLKLALGAGA